MQRHSTTPLPKRAPSSLWTTSRCKSQSRYDYVPNCNFTRAIVKNYDGCLKNGRRSSQSCAYPDKVFLLFGDAMLWQNKRDSLGRSTGAPHVMKWTRLLPSSPQSVIMHELPSDPGMGISRQLETITCPPEFRAASITLSDHPKPRTLPGSTACKNLIKPDNLS